LDKRELQQIGALNRYPIKGSAVIGYFVKKGKVSGFFRVALVEQSGAKQYRLRLFDNTIETFKSIQGKNGRYQYFYLLGYVHIDSYIKYANEELRYFEDIPVFRCEPCGRTVAAYQKQAQKISEIKKQYRKQRLKIPDEVKDGQKISFIHFRCLDDPIIVKYFFAKVFDGSVFAEVDGELCSTNYEESYIYIPKQLLLSVGNESI
jgi:hypothetical protein